MVLRGKWLIGGSVGRRSLLYVVHALIYTTLWCYRCILYCHIYIHTRARTCSLCVRYRVSRPLTWRKPISGPIRQRDLPFYHDLDFHIELNV